MFVVIEPSLPKVREGNRLEPQGRRHTDFQLGVDFSGHLACRTTLRTDTRLVASAVLVVT
jgi:hypothetical protein